MSIRWYNHLVQSKEEPNKPFLLKDESVSYGNIIISQKIKYHTFTKFISVVDLVKFLAKVRYSHNCFYEVIFGNKPHKWYADIDIMLEGKTTEEAKCILPEHETVEVVKCVKLALLKILPIKEENILVASSNGDKKHSYHIVIDGWCSMNKEESKAIFNLVVNELPDRYKSALDPVVYKSIQQFRLYGSHKYDTFRDKVFRDDLSTWKSPIKPINEDHLERLRFLPFLVTLHPGCTILPSFVEEKMYSTIEDDDCQLDKEDIVKALKIFRANYPQHKSFKFLTSNSRFISLKRISPSFCEPCGRTHDNENPYLFIVGEYRHLYFDCRRSEKNKIKLGQLNPK